MTLEIVQHLLKDSIEQEKTIKDLTVEDIMKVVTEFYGVTLSDILSPQRTQTLVTPKGRETFRLLMLKASAPAAAKKE